MNQHKQTKSTNGVVPQSIIMRQDKASSAIVRKGITLQQIHGTKYALDFLKEKQIDIKIIMRVLLNLPTQRRFDDPSTATSDESVTDNSSSRHAEHF
jgi:hypothetical protein